MGCSGRTIPPAAAARRHPPRASPGRWRDRAERRAHPPAAFPEPGRRLLRPGSPRREAAARQHRPLSQTGPSQPARRNFSGCESRSRSIGQRGSQRYRIRRIRHLHFPAGRLAAAAAQQLDPPSRAPDPGLASSEAATAVRRCASGSSAAFGRARSRAACPPLRQRRSRKAVMPERSAASCSRRLATAGSAPTSPTTAAMPGARSPSSIAHRISASRAARTSTIRPGSSPHARRGRGRKDPGGAGTTISPLHPSGGYPLTPTLSPRWGEREMNKPLSAL